MAQNCLHRRRKSYSKKSIKILAFSKTFLYNRRALDRAVSGNQTNPLRPRTSAQANFE